MEKSKIEKNVFDILEEAYKEETVRGTFKFKTDPEIEVFMDFSDLREMLSKQEELRQELTDKYAKKYGDRKIDDAMWEQSVEARKKAGATEGIEKPKNYAEQQANIDIGLAQFRVIFPTFVRDIKTGLPFCTTEGDRDRFGRFITSTPSVRDKITTIITQMTEKHKAIEGAGKNSPTQGS